MKIIEEIPITKEDRVHFAEFVKAIMGMKEPEQIVTLPLKSKMIIVGRDKDNKPIMAPEYIVNVKRSVRISVHE